MTYFVHPLIDKFKLSSLKIYYCYFRYFTVSLKKMEIKRTVEKIRLSISFEEFEEFKSYFTGLSEEFLQLGVSRYQQSRYPSDYRHNTKAAAATGKG